MLSRPSAEQVQAAVRYRIGIHLGDVVIEGDDILGDGVNIAARLEGLAPPGGIAISGSIQEHIVGRIESAFTDAGEQKLKYQTPRSGLAVAARGCSIIGYRQNG